MSGWIKLYRKIEDSSIYPQNREFTKFEAWIDLLLIVNHSDGEILLKNEVYQCKRGQSVRSIETYQNRWSWSRQKVRSFLNMLQKNSMIELKTTTKTTILTICNYDIYQSEQPTDNQRITINKNDKKEKNVKNDKNINSEKFNFKNSLLDLGVNEEILNDWMEVRKKKKASNTKTAYTKFIKQVNLSGLTVNECVQICAEKDWRGFEAEWLINLNYKSNGNSKKQPATTIEDLIEINKKHFG